MQPTAVVPSADTAADIAVVVPADTAAVVPADTAAVAPADTAAVAPADTAAAAPADTAAVVRLTAAVVRPAEPDRSVVLPPGNYKLHHLLMAFHI